MARTASSLGSSANRWVGAWVFLSGGCCSPWCASTARCRCQSRTYGRSRCDCRLLSCAFVHRSHESPVQHEPACTALLGVRPVTWPREACLPLVWRSALQGTWPRPWPLLAPTTYGSSPSPAAMSFRWAVVAAMLVGLTPQAQGIPKHKIRLVGGRLGELGKDWGVTTTLPSLAVTFPATPVLASWSTTLSTTLHLIVVHCPLLHGMHRAGSLHGCQRLAAVDVRAPGHLCVRRVCDVPW